MASLGFDNAVFTFGYNNVGGVFTSMFSELTAATWDNMAFEFKLERCADILDLSHWI